MLQRLDATAFRLNQSSYFLLLCCYFNPFFYIPNIILFSKFFMIIQFINFHSNVICFPFQSGMTKTDAAVQTLSDINPDVVLEVSISQDFSLI